MDKTLPKGHASCLSGAFRYTRASDTDIHKTFDRVRRELARAEPRAAGNVRALTRREPGGSRTN
jgi:hypothetical protein